MVKIGDIFEIPLSDNKFAYGQYVYKDKMGPIIQVFDFISINRIRLDQINRMRPLFPPIITGLFVAIRLGIWQVIGKKSVNQFVYPNFVSAYYDEKTGKVNTWFLWNGERYINIGSILPSKYRNLEYLISWNPEDVVNRIETGKYIFPFRDLILNNEFVPKRFEE